MAKTKVKIKDIFFSPTKGEVHLEEIAELIVQTVINSDGGCRLIVGTDSKKHTDYLTYVTVIILYRIGKGGVYFYQRQRSEVGRYSLQAAIYHETALSLAVAARLDDLLKKHGLTDLEIEIHSDVGNHGKTKELIQEVVSWINASGYTAQIKPESFGASTVADKYTD
ncbi:MAG: ribonuclease H-like YkuK family protein [Candidatus Desulfofervidus auxilii]|nr:ribonuclease H-like YkuK family protein [Candidatus Desulfofervidus auxilii]